MYLAYTENTKHHRLQILIDNLNKTIVIIEDTGRATEGKKPEQIAAIITKYCGPPDIGMMTLYEDGLQITFKMTRPSIFQSLQLVINALSQPYDPVSYSVVGKRISRTLIEHSPLLFQEVFPSEENLPAEP